MTDYISIFLLTALVAFTCYIISKYNKTEDKAIHKIIIAISFSLIIILILVMANNYLNNKKIAKYPFIPIYDKDGKQISSQIPVPETQYSLFIEKLLFSTLFLIPLFVTALSALHIWEYPDEHKKSFAIVASYLFISACSAIIISRLAILRDDFFLSHMAIMLALSVIIMMLLNYTIANIKRKVI